jgi:hypothetical protein
MSPKCYSDNRRPPSPTASPIEAVKGWRRMPSRPAAFHRLREPSSEPAPVSSSRAAWRAWSRLAGWTAAVATIWLIALPWAAARPAMQQRIRFLEQQRIDPSAMFYTEIEMMQEVQDRIDRLRHQHAEHFWNPVPENDSRPLPVL